MNKGIAHEVGGHAQNLLVEAARKERAVIINMLESASREWDKLRESTHRYIAYQDAADKITGQA